MNAFPTSASEIRQLGEKLVKHLASIPDTHTPKEWTSKNLAALRDFNGHGLEVKHYPASEASNQKGAFLWDYIAYQQGHGILIVAESEHDLRSEADLKHDFEKLFYAIAPIKLFIIRGDRDKKEPTGKIVQYLRQSMTECCSRFTPGELYILYCRTWQDESKRSGDRAYFLQVPGEPNEVRALTDSDQFADESLAR